MQGFMCYREETEICFSGSSICALCGANGAGKSTIFDAMRYALYGEHRLGDQHDEELIHRDTVSFLVEFDFVIDENEYRVKRTYSRKKKSTRLAMHLRGPAAPIPGRSGPQPIPGTEEYSEFNRWVLRTIGLDEKTFTVSVLLLQGQSDALLRSKGAARHQMLTQLIDLSRYEALCKRAGSKQKEQEGLVKSYVAQLNTLEEVDDAHVLNLESQISEAEMGREEARSRQLHLTELKEQAKRWQKLQGDEQQLIKNLAACTALLEHTTQIEQQAARLDTLQKVTSPLEQIYSWQGEYASFKTQFEQDCKKVQTLKGALQEQNKKLCVTQQQLNELQAQRAKTDREQKELQPRLLELQTACSEIAHLQRLQQKYRDIGEQISAYTPDLGQQQEYLWKRLAELKRIEDAQPRLKQFAQQRSRWQEAALDLTDAQQELSNHEELLAEIEEQTNLLLEQITELSDQLSSLQSKVASKETLQKESEKHLARFQSIDGQPTCSYCGQALTSEHLDAERQRIEAELQEARRVCQEALAQHTTMAQQKKILETKLGQLSLQKKSQQQIIKKCEEQRYMAKGEQDGASTQAIIVLQLLTPDYITRIQGTANAPIDLPTCLQSVYPTAHDLEELASQLRDKPSLQENLRTVASDVEERAELQRTRDYVFNEIQPLEQMYPPEHVTALLQEQDQALQRNEALLGYLDKLDDTLTQQSQQLEDIRNEKQQAEQEKGKLERAVAIAETKLENAQRSIEDAQATLPVEWQAQVERLSEALLSSWKQEMEALAGSTELLRDLQNAQQNYAHYRQELVDLGVEKDLIPEEARQAPAQLEQASEQANLSYKTFEDQERKLGAEIVRLKNIQDGRIELEKQRAGASRLASFYKDLTNLLGRDGLQHYLIQKAEAGIVYHANEILDRISGGTLRLELQSTTDRKAEALDIVAYNTAISASQTQPIRLLSGSQQFRVSVSLALGIGKYAGNENHRVESVIIDEGFGSLDENGRREMIQAIKELGDGGVLKCIIVVSHQREFFDEFSNRYLVELVDGSTQISLV
jgi:DNA repair exonuclease SbcCD ATPase subunit